MHVSEWGKYVRPAGIESVQTTSKASVLLVPAGLAMLMVNVITSPASPVLGEGLLAIVMIGSTTVSLGACAVAVQVAAQPGHVSAALFWSVWPESHLLVAMFRTTAS